MAKGLSWKRSNTETISVKGVFNETATVITYVEDKEEKTIKVQDLLDKFASTAISLNIKAVSEEELDIEEVDEIDIDDLSGDDEDDDYTLEEKLAYTE